jgi:hypothetical protein
MPQPGDAELVSTPFIGGALVHPDRQQFATERGGLSAVIAYYR